MLFKLDEIIKLDVSDASRVNEFNKENILNFFYSFITRIYFQEKFQDKKSLELAIINISKKFNHDLESFYNFFEDCKDIWDFDSKFSQLFTEIMDDLGINYIYFTDVYYGFDENMTLIPGCLFLDTDPQDYGSEQDTLFNEDYPEYPHLIDSLEYSNPKIWKKIQKNWIYVGNRMVGQGCGGTVIEIYYPIDIKLAQTQFPKYLKQIGKLKEIDFEDFDCYGDFEDFIYYVEEELNLKLKKK